MGSYSDLLRSPMWQKKRLEVMQAKGFACEICGNTEQMLHVHHKEYFKGYKPWEYDVEQLALLCEQCHTKVHSETDFLKYVISRLPLDGPNSRDEITGLLVGYLGYFTEEEAKEGRMNRYVLLGIEAKKKGNQDGV
jgi:hypothetical protein